MGDQGDRFSGVVFRRVAVAAVHRAHGVCAQIPDGGAVGGDSIADAAEPGHHKGQVGERTAGGGQDDDPMGHGLRNGLAGAGVTSL